MIKIEDLCEKDIGAWVVYDDGITEDIGRIKAWKENYIFVVFKCSDDWDNFDLYTSQACCANHLTKTFRIKRRNF